MNIDNLKKFLELYHNGHLPIKTDDEILKFIKVIRINNIESGDQVVYDGAGFIVEMVFPHINNDCEQVFTSVMRLVMNDYGTFHEEFTRTRKEIAKDFSIIVPEGFYYTLTCGKSFRFIRITP